DENFGIAAIAPLPRSITKDGGTSRAGSVVLLQKQSSDCRTRAQQVEQVRRDVDGADLFGFAVAGEIVIAANGDSDVFKSAVTIFDVEVLCSGEPILRNAEPGRAIPEDDEAIGVFVGKRMQEESAQDAVDRGRRANADGEGKDSGESEAGIFSEAARGIEKVG